MLIRKLADAQAKDTDALLNRIMQEKKTNEERIKMLQCATFALQTFSNSFERRKRINKA